jgi:protein-disulfide isomerase
MSEDSIPRQPSLTPRSVLLGFVLVVGAGYAHLLTVIHQNVGAEGGSSAWSCGGGEWFSCSGNLASRYSTLFGLPVSAYAAGWFLFLLAMLVHGVIRGRAGVDLYKRLLLATMPAVAATFVYAGISVFVLKTICLYCVGTYGVVGVTVMLAAAGAGIEWERVRRVAATGMRIGGRWAIPAAAFVAAVGFERWYVSRPSATPAAANATSLASVPRLGPRNAPMKIVLFSDFECPACRVAAKELDQFLARHPGEVEVQLVSVPVGRHGGQAGKAAPLAEFLGASLGVVMHRRGQFWDFYKGVFLAERPVDERLLWEVAGRVAGVHEIPGITAELGKPEVKAALRRNAAIVEKYKATRIPTFYINGQVSVGALKVEVLEAKLAELRKETPAEMPGIERAKVVARGN